MTLCPKDLSIFKTSTNFNEYLAESDHQIIVTTCEMARMELLLLENQKDFIVSGLPPDADYCTAVDGPFNSDEDELYRENLDFFKAQVSMRYMGFETKEDGSTTL